MRAVWIACALTLGPTAAAVAQTPLTFGDALAVAQRANDQLRAAAAHLDGARESQAAERGLRFPTVTALGGYMHMNDRLFVDLDALKPVLSALNPSVPIPHLEATVLENDPYRVGVTAHWTVYAGGRIDAANRAAHAGVTGAEQLQRTTEDGVMTELVDRYFKRRLAADALEVRRQALETFTRHLEDSRRLKAAGQIARKDELRAEVARAEAEREWKKAQRDVDLASVALNATLGNTVEADPTTPLALIVGLPPRESFAQSAEAANPVVGRIAALRDQAHEGARALHGERRPSVSLLGGYDFFDRGLNTTADPKWMVGIAARWELFDGGTRAHRARAAEHVEAAAGFETERVRHDVNTLVRQRYDEYESALEQYQSLETTIALSEESLRAERDAYAAGVGTSLDVVDAELALSRARVDRLTAIYQLDVALARLLEASGRSAEFVEYLSHATPVEELR